MLEAMGRAGAPVPQVLAVSDSVLVLSELQDDGALESAGWAELGTALRQLHASRGPVYGWPEDFAFGAVSIPNAGTETWPAFWAERRLLPSCPHLPADMATRIERLARNLPDLLPDPPPSLLHGDLWTGNILAASGHLSGLIDPACYHGDPEVDLAMLHLFGSPGGGFSEAYGPLRPGAEARRPIYQLWPALVHVRLFGAGYHSLVSRLLSACGH